MSYAPEDRRPSDGLLALSAASFIVGIVGGILGASYDVKLGLGIFVGGAALGASTGTIFYLLANSQENEE